jgi:hypothetical protein
MEGRDAEMDQIMENKASANQSKGEEIAPSEKVDLKV